MTSRRKFLKISALGALAGSALSPLRSFGATSFSGVVNDGPVILSTWRHGLAANEAAWAKLQNGGSMLDAVEAGVRVTESDPKNTSVGYGGRPDREGHVTLDACIMDHEARCGSVAGLEHIKNPISVARMVMDKTPHVMLVGDGALQFALQNGFKKENLLTPDSEKAWKEWLVKSDYQPIPNVENHDTIGMIGMDADGTLAGACTTSGLAYKLRGRVGDSPIIGAGLFVDSDVGACTATGLGEMVIRTCGSHLVVELMRQGHSPEKACQMAVDRIIAKHKSLKNAQVGYIAVNKNGEYGGYALRPGFNFAVHTTVQNEMVDSQYRKEW